MSGSGSRHRGDFRRSPGRRSAVKGECVRAGGPDRVLDTRNGTGAPRGPATPHSTTHLTITGHNGVPATGVSAAVLTLTVTQPTATGYLTAYAGGTSAPTASNLNFTANHTTANLVIAPVDPTTGTIDIYNGSSGTTHLIADLAGYYLTGASGSGFGNDISWGQCGDVFPAGSAFGIVGVNDGLANTTNPCLPDELAWAANAPGIGRQPAADLYVNTANPGPASASWPTSNRYPASANVDNPYGSCTGGDTPACAYMYGYAKAYDDATIRGVPTPNAFTWWLDVERGNSWEADMHANVADLEGMVTYLRDIGAQVGLYASRNDWAAIAGAVPATSSLSALPSWLAGATSLAAAQAACSAAPLTAGPVELVQYDAGTVDYDVACR